MSRLVATACWKVVAGVIVSDIAGKVVVQPVGAPQGTLAVNDIESRTTAKVSPMPPWLSKDQGADRVTDRADAASA